MSVMPIDNRKDFLLLMLYSPGASKEFNEAISGRTRLVKMLFLFKKEALKKFKKSLRIDENNFYEFFAWNFGPFSSQVYDDLNFFVLQDFIEVIKTDEEASPEAAAEWERWADNSDEDEVTDYEEQAFRLSEKGTRFAERLYAGMDDEQRSFLKEFKSKLVRAPLAGILRYVYQNYPDFTTKSKIKDKVLDS